ncbi:MAG: hypothetical protein A3C06_01680 [Candidatus Taylorbacteria bacterium RIFCSPHIGHO2_02_FULL_46_13]|uniref:Uncharacterized protein n=1 Tax=Candidatus Taylorbacteria bacterium RIFCSPHIGHO2_02_FULL_46_13 TaxID=1802312 RepID=A0A1G2MTU0_9BACT|nr:MAG: hypothetical protein A3C06_01680 [Candidatus Taylorbacteria bacterium RIFCSPHIGHO2_02_FULL_46_13]
MEFLRYFDTRKNRAQEFIRYQLSRGENWFVLEILQCKSFSADVATGELYREEFRDESAAEEAYRNKLSLAETLSPSVLIQKEIWNSK